MSMRNRFAVPTTKTIERYISERNAYMEGARSLYDAHGDARVVLALLNKARERSRKVVWAKRYLGLHRTSLG